MENYKLTNEDYGNLKKLFTVTAVIRNIYLKLSELESSDKKDTIEYKNLFDSLNGFLMIEENIYRKIGTDPKKISELLFYMLNYTQISLDDSLNYIYHGLEDNMIKARISTRFEKIINNAEFPKPAEDFDTEESYEDDLEEDIETDEETLSALSKVENAELQFKYMASLETEFEKDLINTILKVLSEYIFNPAYARIKARLIQYKYLIAFTYKPAEKDFLAHNFEINPTLYWSSKTVIDLYNGNPEDLEVLKCSYAEDLLFDQSDNLIELFFEDLQDVSNYEKAIISQIIIRACSLFASPKTLDAFTSFLLGELEDSEEHNKELEAIIKEALDKLEEDKSLPNVISLKLEQ